MKISILDIKLKSTSIHITTEQKAGLKSLFKNENIEFIITRYAIRINRLRDVLQKLSSKGKITLEKILNEVEVRAGMSKCIKINFYTNLTPEMCWLYGFLIGDGNLLHSCRFYNSNSKLVEEVNRIVKRYFNIEIRKEPNRPIDYFIPMPVLLILECFFGKKGKSVSARVPKIIFSMSNDFVAAFIRGIFDTDGTIVGNPCITTPNLWLLNDIQLLLQNKFDIESRIRKYENKDSYVEYTLTLGVFDRVKTFGNVLKFYEKIGFSHPEKKLKLEMKIKRRTLYAVLQLVEGGFHFSDQIRDVLNKD